MTSAPQTLVVPAEAQNDRLDRWLAAAFPDQSRTTIQRWIKSGLVLVDGHEGRANHRLTAGATVTVEIPVEAVPPAAAAEAIDLQVLYEDGDILVVDKPAGLVVHPAPGHPTGTLVNALLHRIPDLGGIGGELRPGIVHRLDKDTSGVMVVAKHERALRMLQHQFKGRKVEKEYLALTEGTLSKQRGVINTAIGRDPRDRKRMATFTTAEVGKARPAVTEYEVAGHYTVAVRNDQGRGTFTLVRAHPITGRTHQIRVHLASIGHPIVGDPIYGLKRQRLPAPRLMLHAARLRLIVPGSGVEQTFIAPLPADFASLLTQLTAQQTD